jgi:hypothetical protein
LTSKKFHRTIKSKHTKKAVSNLKQPFFISHSALITPAPGFPPFVNKFLTHT